MRCGDKELALACDWAVGIGGALWSMGLELVQHLHAFRDHYARVFKDSTVVELGTGTGLVGTFAMCRWLGCIHAAEHTSNARMVVVLVELQAWQWLQCLSRLAWC